MNQTLSLFHLHHRKFLGDADETLGMHLLHNFYFGCTPLKKWVRICFDQRFCTWVNNLRAGRTRETERGKCLICHWNIDSWKQKLSFGYLMDPKNIKIQHRLLLVTIRVALLVKIKIKSYLKMHLFRDISPNWVLTYPKETSCYIFKMGTFSKFFGDFLRHVIR